LKWYRLFHEAWTDHPPGDWLLAAQVGYTSPAEKRKKAIANTKLMFDMITGFEKVAKDKLN